MPAKEDGVSDVEELGGGGGERHDDVVPIWTVYL
jgi:hypothetical protein